MSSPDAHVKRRRAIKNALRWVLAASMIAVGALHFINPDPFVKIVPAALPAPLVLVWVSGVFEILGGVGLLVPRTRRAAAFGLVALYVAVFPANINMAVNHIQIGDEPLPPIALWGRLPLQLVFIAWALWYTRPDPDDAARPPVGEATPTARS